MIPALAGIAATAIGTIVSIIATRRYRCRSCGASPGPEV